MTVDIDWLVNLSVPGDVEGIQAMVSTFGTIGGDAQGVSGQLRRLMDSSDSGNWQGQASDAFADVINHDLADNLDRISTVFSGMASVLQQWLPHLEWAQWRVKTLVGQARQELDALDADRRAAAATATAFVESSNTHYQQLESLSAQTQDVLQNHYQPEADNCWRALQNVMSGSYTDDLGTAWNQVTHGVDTAMGVVVKVGEGIVDQITSLPHHLEELYDDVKDHQWSAALGDVVEVVGAIGTICTIAVLCCSGLGLIGLVGADAAAVVAIGDISEGVGAVSDVVTMTQVGDDVLDRNFSASDVLDLGFMALDHTSDALGDAHDAAAADESLQTGLENLSDAEGNLSGAAQKFVMTGDRSDLDDAISSMGRVQDQIYGATGDLVDAANNGVTITTTVTHGGIDNTVNYLGHPLPGSETFWASAATGRILGSASATLQVTEIGVGGYQAAPQ